MKAQFQGGTCHVCSDPPPPPVNNAFPMAGGTENKFELSNEGSLVVVDTLVCLELKALFD